MLKRFWSAILICLLLPIGCSQEEPTTRVDLSKKEQIGQREEANVITYA
ncbi:MAG: phosphonate ABC transporter substrate-binding protein, partial [Proteobacteria bacterium]|nr:phosphonate ABC transporter substrate-binding protein [Pseudomonadota bacterium]